MTPKFERAGRLVVGQVGVVGAERELFVSAGDGEPADGGAVEPVRLVERDAEFVVQDLIPPAVVEPVLRLVDVVAGGVEQMAEAVLAALVAPRLTE